MPSVQHQAIHDPFKLFCETAANVYSDSFQYMNAYLEEEIPTSSQEMWVRFYAWDFHQDPPREIVLGDNGRVGGELRQSRVQIANFHHNWLLVSTFEALERFMKDIYAGTIFNDPTLWGARDVSGGVQAGVKKLIPWLIGGRKSNRVKNLANMDLPAIRTEVRKTIARQSTTPIVKFLRNDFQLNDGTRNPGCDSLAYCSLRFWFAVAELLRHAIVHSEGFIYGTETDIMKMAASKTGESFTGKSESVVNNQRQLKRFLREVNPGCFEIWTTSRTQLTNKAPGAHGPFRFLMTGITSLALLVYSCVCDSLGVERISTGKR